MNDQLSKIDHLAIIVENIEESVEYYSTKFNCEVKHKDAINKIGFGLVVWSAAKDS